MLQALGEINKEGPGPVVVAISTTGLPTTKARDVPLLLLPLYRLMLANPHSDKEKMEELLAAAPSAYPPPPDPATTPTAPIIKTYTIVRASLLTNGSRLGAEKVRAGTEEKPAVGYTISREDVGGWVFEQVVENGGRVEQWGGRRVTVTY